LGLRYSFRQIEGKHHGGRRRISGTNLRIRISSSSASPCFRDMSTRSHLVQQLCRQLCVFFGLDDRVWLRILDDLGLIQVIESPQTIDGIDASSHVTPKYKFNVQEITIQSFIDDIGLRGRLELVPMSSQRTADERRVKHWMLRIKVAGSEINPTRLGFQSRKSVSRAYTKT
jgi:hypothetical protein